MLIRAILVRVEVELVSDRIAILNKGRLMAFGPVKELLGGKEEAETLENYFLNIIEGGA